MRCFQARARQDANRVLEPVPNAADVGLCIFYDALVPEGKKSKLMKKASLLLALAVSLVARFILLLGIFLGSHVPAIAQTPAPQIVPGQERAAPAMSMLRTVSTPLPAASFLLSQDPGKSPANFSFPFAGASERDYSLKDLWPIDEVQTLVLTQSSLTLVQLWGGRLQLGAFKSTRHIQSMRLVGNGSMQSSRFLRQIGPGAPPTINLSGLSLSFRFGRDARTEHPTQLWQRLARIASATLN